MPICSRSSCSRRSGDVSISRLPPGRPRIALHRVRRFSRIVAAADVAAAADHRHADAGAGAQQDHLAANVGR